MPPVFGHLFDLVFLKQSKVCVVINQLLDMWSWFVIHIQNLVLKVWRIKCYLAFARDVINFCLEYHFDSPKEKPTEVGVSRLIANQPFSKYLLLMALNENWPWAAL